MKPIKPEVNYLKLRPTNLFSETYRHLLLLIYWPIYGALFWFVETHYSKFYDKLGIELHEMYLPIDDMIPFNELFVIPYVFWFLYIVLSIAYTLFYDVDMFKKMSYFIMITYTCALISYYTYPTMQCLRPESFARDNFLVDFMRDFYAYDTNTNVCPSVHVFGSISSTIAFAGTKKLGSGIKITAHVMNVLIILSTLFLKQHSVIDAVVALVISAVAYVIVFRPGIFAKRKPAS
ncbi:MAG: phosphatidic acid phosphatase [Ruminococcaceae bacterium]|nr:phosphatidic acid phosphatase [Oscillospiraceae bacterium]